MPYFGGMSSAQIINLALQDTRRGPNFAPQAELLFNAILRDLCLNYDLEVNKRFATINIDGTPSGPTPNNITLQVANVGNVQPPGTITVPPTTAVGFAAGMGPYALPFDYLRAASNGMQYSFNGAPFSMIERPISELFYLALNPTSPSNPTLWASRFYNASNNTQITFSELYVYPAPQQLYVVNLLYFCLQPDVVSPSSVNNYIWFPEHQYLRTELAARLMLDEDMHKQALEHLERYLQNEPDTELMATTIKLDPNQFRPRSSSYRLPPLKGRDL